MLLEEQLPEHKGRQAQQQERPWHVGDCREETGTENLPKVQGGRETFPGA